MSKGQIILINKATKALQYLKPEPSMVSTRWLETKFIPDNFENHPRPINFPQIFRLTNQPLQNKHCLMMTSPSTQNLGLYNSMQVYLYSDT